MNLDKNALALLIGKCDALHADIVAAVECWQKKLDIQAAIDPTGSAFNTLETEHMLLTNAAELAASLSAALVLASTYRTETVRNNHRDEKK